MYTELQQKKTIKVYQISKCHQIQILNLRCLEINHQEGAINRVYHQFKFKIKFLNKKLFDRCLQIWVKLPEGIRQPILEEVLLQVCMYKFLLRNQKLFFSKLKSKCVSVTYKHELTPLIHSRKKMKMEMCTSWFKKH